MTQDAKQATSGNGVFVSYASQDAAIADAVVENLERRGITCWIAPRDVKPGSRYADQIADAINAAKVIVLVLSEYALASPHLGREIERAASKRLRIVALRIDATPLTRSFEYYLGESQWIYVAALGMPAALTKLTQTVGQDLEPSSWVSPGLGTDVRNPAERKRKPSYPIFKRAGAAAVLLAVAALVLGVMVRYWPSKHKGPQAPVVKAISDKSIAVLPFADMSRKKDQEYFGDGMAEEIWDQLAKIPGLTLIGRSSSFQVKDKNADPQLMGSELNAAYVLEGSVSSSGGQVRVTAQLINTRTGAHEWSETYDRPTGEVLNLQSVVAAAVARELRLPASGELQARSTSINPQAYHLYLRARHAADHLDRDGLEEAAALLQQALELDATFAEAAAELALVCETQGEDGFLKPAVAFERARDAAATALRLDPKSARAHYVMGLVNVFYDWDWAAAAREFQDVAALSPGSPDALTGRGLLSLAFGRWDDALKQVSAAIAQDPLSTTGYYVLAEIQLRRGLLGEAATTVRRGLEIRPSNEWGRGLLGLVLQERGDRDAALREYEQLTSQGSREMGLAMAYYALGRNAESDGALGILLKNHADEDSYDIAVVYAFRRQSDEAMHFLERAYAQKEPGMTFVKVDMPLKNLEGDPRYQALLKKMNLPKD